LNTSSETQRVPEDVKKRKTTVKPCRNWFHYTVPMLATCHCNFSFYILIWIFFPENLAKGSIRISAKLKGGTEKNGVQT